jgi:RNase P/RNase MRP subunit p29
MRVLRAVLILVAVATIARGEVLELRGGDRVSGKVAFEGKKTLRLRTAYGVLTVPRADIVKRIHDDGREETFAEGAAKPAPARPATAARATLVVSVRGASFWQAWDPRSAPADTRLRLRFAIDEQDVASYVDAALDDDIPGALVNTFTFIPAHVRATAGTGAEAAPPVTRGGGAELRIGLPASLAEGTHRLTIAYQVASGTTSDPQWQDTVVTGTDVTVKPGEPIALTLRQDRGRMEYAKKRMKAVETFLIEAQ